MKAPLMTLVVAAVIFAGACRQNEVLLTEPEASRVVAGQVVISESDSQIEFSEVTVTVRGTGIRTGLSDDGTFRLAGLPDSDVEIVFWAGGRSLKEVTVGRDLAESVVVALGRDKAPGQVKPRKRGVGHPGAEIQGTLKSVSADSIVVSDKRGNDILIRINAQTVIRSGGTTLTVADLKSGQSVHVKASVGQDGARTAIEIHVQGGAARESDKTEVSGTVSSVAAGQLLVRTRNGQDMTVRVDAATLVTRRKQPASFSEIKVGDRVEAEGTRIDATTILASKIEIED